MDLIGKKIIQTHFGTYLNTLRFSHPERWIQAINRVFGSVNPGNWYGFTMEPGTYPMAVLVQKAYGKEPYVPKYFFKKLNPYVERPLLYMSTHLYSLFQDTLLYKQTPVRIKVGPNGSYSAGTYNAAIVTPENVFRITRIPIEDTLQPQGLSVDETTACLSIFYTVLLYEYVQAYIEGEFGLVEGISFSNNFVVKIKNVIPKCEIGPFYKKFNENGIEFALRTDEKGVTSFPLVTVMENAGLELGEFIDTYPSETKLIGIQVCIVLYILQEVFDIVHSDIKYNNICVKKQPTSYTLLGRRYTFKNTVTLIDMDSSCLYSDKIEKQMYFEKDHFYSFGRETNWDASLKCNSKSQDCFMYFVYLYFKNPYFVMQTSPLIYKHVKMFFDYFEKYERMYHRYMLNKQSMYSMQQNYRMEPYSEWRDSIGIETSEINAPHLSRFFFSYQFKHLMRNDPETKKLVRKLEAFFLPRNIIENN